MNSNRLSKVAAYLKREISIMVQNDLPEELGMVSVSDIYLTNDFKEAKIYVSVFDVEKEDQAIKILTEKTPAFQRILGRKLKMKFTPKISFHLDKYQDKLNNINKLIGDIDHGA